MRNMSLLGGFAWAVAWTGIAGCATEGGRVAGPGAFVAGVGTGLINAHDAVARSLLGDAAKPMLIGAPDPASSVAAQDESDDRAVPARATTARHQAASADLSRIDVVDATSADLDGDGVVSMDEILALGRSGLGDSEVLERLQRTGRTFDLSSSQEQYLSTRGISDDLIDHLRTLNRIPDQSPGIAAGPVAVPDSATPAR
jgi:hypothetical protein